MSDTRYPYTYSCDLIRHIAGYNKEGTKLSRSDASKIRELFSKIIGYEDEKLAICLADYYLANHELMDKEDVELMRKLLEERNR
jgi:hypothetical protein